MPPQSRQGKRRISTRRDNEMHLRWQVFHKKGKGVLNSRILNHMVVIEHQGKVRQLHAHEIVDEQSKREFYRCWRRGLVIQQTLTQQLHSAHLTSSGKMRQDLLNRSTQRRDSIFL